MLINVSLNICNLLMYGKLVEARKGKSISCEIKIICCRLHPQRNKKSWVCKFSWNFSSMKYFWGVEHIVHYDIFHFIGPTAVDAVKHCVCIWFNFVNCLQGMKGKCGITKDYARWFRENFWRILNICFCLGIEKKKMGG